MICSTERQCSKALHIRWRRVRAADSKQSEKPDRLSPSTPVDAAVPDHHKLLSKVFAGTGYETLCAITLSKEPRIIFYGESGAFDGRESTFGYTEVYTSLCDKLIDVCPFAFLGTAPNYGSDR